MKGIILAGGEGTRLRPLTLEIPKPLITIRKKPLINYNLGLFSKYGVNDVKMIIRPADEREYGRWHREYASEFPGTKIELVTESVPMGTLGYLFHHLRGWMGKEDVFVTNGDDIKNLDLAAMRTFHKAQKIPVTIALMKMEQPDDYGAVLVTGKRVREFIEKRAGTPPGLVSAGMYIVRPAALERLAGGAEAGPAPANAASGATSGAKKFLMFEKDLFPALAKTGELGAFIAEGTFFDCGTFERWEKAIREA